MQVRSAGGQKRTFAASIAIATVAALAVGIGGTATSESASWPDGRVATLWPTFSALTRHESGGVRLRSWNGSFERCVASVRVQLDYRCEYADSAGAVGYACLSAGNPWRDLSIESVTAVVGPADPTYGSASPAQVCLASLAYALSLS